MVRKEYKLTKPKEILARANVLKKEKGLFYVINFGIKLIIKQIVNYFWCYFIYKPFKSSRTFRFKGLNYNYFYHIYNTTWKNERAIEIPIILDVMKNYKGVEILEVGNVISHYFPTAHDILDKYEKVSGVINRDVAEFRSEKKYNLIISISTIEHVGWDEKPRNQNKIPSALKNLESLLNKGGKLVVTLPLGYNSYLDELLSNNGIKFTHLYCFRRMGESNTWEETVWENIRNTKPGQPVKSLIIGVIEKN